MHSVNFNQLLCTGISEDGTDISGIFDTLICEPGKNRFIICVFFSQCFSSDEAEKKYYYRMILRYLPKKPSEKKHLRIDSGVFWDSEKMSRSGAMNTKESRHESTIAGSSGTLAINFSFEIDSPGNYEVDLYVKEMTDSDTFDELDKVSVKKLEFETVSPFQVVFKTNSNQ